MSTEDSIVERVVAGEVEAFAEIIEQHQRSIWRIAAHALRDVAATEDLVQQVFVSAYFHLDQYQRGRDLGAWLRAIARNEVRKTLRQGQRDQSKLRRYYDWASTVLESDVASEQREAAVREALRRCREELAPVSAEALRLRYDQALDFEQIAALLSRTLVATRQLLSRTRLALRDCIEKRMAHT
jgi:RNA polymerase sigma-70 factor, ECF subfamily